MLEKFSLGTGDRFGQQGKAQLKAVQKANEKHNVLITPVWNKSNREHKIIGTHPQDVRNEANKATRELGWEYSYFVDADHITKESVDPYLEPSDFFTIDVAEYIGKKCNTNDWERFFSSNKNLIGTLKIPGIQEEFQVTKEFLKKWANQYLYSIQQAKEIYQYIKNQKSEESVFEISIDEVGSSQTPLDLFFLLKTVAEHGVEINTIAPKFTGEFYKGVNYVGDIDQFVKEFEQNILVIKYIKNKFDVPSDLKMSVHSGSDKFDLYPHISKLLSKYNAGLHLKTAGTTWLEELIGLAVVGGEGQTFVKKIYGEAYQRYDEITQPYLPVINVKKHHLPEPNVFQSWTGKQICSKLTHNPANPDYDPKLRQFLHCSYKIAAEHKDTFIPLLKKHRKQIGERVTENLYDRHIYPLFIQEVC